MIFTFLNELQAAQLYTGIDTASKITAAGSGGSGAAAASSEAPPVKVAV